MDFILFPMVSPAPVASIGSVATDTFLWCFAIVMPFVIFALVVHWIETFVFTRLAERFGWKVVLWTGWLGTPIHELSHALMCRVFQHRIDEIALFEPDLQSGRLGFVRHSYHKGNWFQELGNFFIGIAPLIGGSLVLGCLLWLFYPDAVSAAVGSGSLEENANPNPFNAVSAVLGHILTIENLVSLRFWAFIYLVLCVGLHMAPSQSDYAGAGRSVWMILTAIALTGFVLAISQVDVVTGVGQMATFLSPLFALFLLTIALCSLAATLVYSVTSFVPRRQF